MTRLAVQCIPPWPYDPVRKRLYASWQHPTTGGWFDYSVVYNDMPTEAQRAEFEKNAEAAFAAKGREAAA